MTTKAKIADDGRTITVRVPITIRKRGGRKVVMSPDGKLNGSTVMGQRIDNAMVKAVARAFRWREMLENGTHSTITELAHAERIDHSYIGRILRLTLLAPDVVEAMLDGRQPSDMTLSVLMHPFPTVWKEQRAPPHRPARRREMVSM